MNKQPEPKKSNASTNQADRQGGNPPSSARPADVGAAEATAAPQAPKPPSQVIKGQEDLSDGTRGERPLGAGKHKGTVAAQEETAPPDQPTPLVELLRGIEEREIRQLLIKADTQKIASPAVAYRGPRVNLDLPVAVYKSLLLPTDVEDYKSLRKLFDSVRVLVQQHGMLSDRQARLVTYWVFASWFPDFLPFVPSLVITGPAFAADQLLRALRCVCRRPVLLAGVSPAVLRAVTCNQVMPTLLIRAPQLSRTMAALLEASNQPGYFVSSGKHVWQFYCAKGIYLGENGNQHVLGPRSIHVHTGTNAAVAGRSLPSDDVVQGLQNQMLYYRLVAHDHVASSKFGIGGFLPELRALAQVLGAPIDGDPELQGGITELLKERDGQARVDRSGGLDAMVLRAVLWHCHQTDQQQVFVREIAATVNGIYRQEGESLSIGNESVGHVLKNLGLYTRRLGSSGRGLLLDKSTQIQVHELAQAQELLTEMSESPLCGHCHKPQLQQS